MLAKKILIVDDHPIYLDGLELILNEIFQESILIRASSIKEAKELVEKYVDFDWIILDQRLPDGSGLELLVELRSAFIAAPIVIVSALDEIELIDACLRSGANGFVGKGAGKSLYIECFEKLELGEVFLSPDIQEQLLYYREFSKNEAERTMALLTDRQKEILPLLIAGYSNQEIGESLNIALSTVKSHVAALINNFDCDNRTHCAAEARRLGFTSHGV